MKKEFDFFIDVRNEDCPVPMIKVDIVSRILDKGELLKVATNNESSYQNIKNLISNKASLTLVGHVRNNEDYLLYIKRI